MKISFDSGSSGLEERTVPAGLTTIRLYKQTPSQPEADARQHRHPGTVRHAPGDSM